MDQGIPVRFEHTPRHHLAAFSGEPPAPGTRVVVAGEKGPRLATVRGGPRPGKVEYDLLRVATPEDLRAHAELKERAEAVKWRLKAHLRRRLPGVRPAAVEYTIDGKVAFLYLRAKEKRRLGGEIRELARIAGARVELVFLGERDEVAVLGALGPCGMETCCSTWMQEFGSSTIRMARDQQLPLSPEKISGPCGRLLCCIAFEHPVYKELLDKLPRKNARVCTRAGVCGKVAKHHPLKLEVEIKTEAGGLVTARLDELAPWEEGNEGEKGQGQAP